MSELIGNRFECIEEIGKGTDSIVFRGVDRQTDASVAIKIITASSSSGFNDLRNEINARRACQSPDIVPIIAYGTFDTDSGPRHYIVTPFLEGETLELRITNRAEPFDEKDALRIVAKIALTLRPIHESGIFHSDLKPSNIFFTSDGEIKLLDFGLAGKSGQSGISAGTACYASPEQLLGEQCDLRADLYSLGCILYELVTGHPPFISDDIAEILFNQVNSAPQPPIRVHPDISEFANALILNLLEKSPEARFQSTLELEQTLQVCETGSWWCERIAGDSDGKLPDRKIQGLPAPRSWQVPLVGRKTELDRLCRKISDSTDAGSGCFIVVGGAAGVGKTRLIEEALARCGAEAFILNSRCIKFDTRVPYLPLIDLVEDLMRRERFDSSRFQRFLTRHLVQTPLLVPKFMEFLSKQSQVSGDPGGLTTDNLLYLFTALFHHMASESPVVLFI
ncbi:MAG: protein kinase, partial [bacterium]